MAMLLGKKIGMTQVCDQNGKMVPVTVIQAGPCVVMQIKTPKTDGYDALQLGFDDIKPSRAKKPQTGHAEKSKVSVKRFVREWRIDKDSQVSYQAGQQIDVSTFAETNFVDVSGISKGKGYAGVMKRHGFGGFPASHGTERKHRAGGSIASHATNRGHSGKPKKGKRMGGHMGNVRVTARNHRLISIDQQSNLLVVKGAVPGPCGTYLEIRTAKTKK